MSTGRLLVALVVAAIGALVLWSGRSGILGIAGVLIASPALALAPAFFLASQTFDASAAALLVRPLESALPLATLLRLRIGADALGISLPTGPLLADGFVLRALCARGARFQQGMAVLLDRRFFMGLAHGLWLTAGTLVGWEVLRSMEARLPASPPLAALLLFAGLLVSIACLLVLRRLSRGRTRGAASSVRARVGIVALSLGALLCETAESAFILRTLGSGLGWQQVMCFDSAVSLLRALLVIVPAGLGVQEVSYLAFLTALNVPDPLALTTALSVVKRSRELLFLMIGYAFVAAETANDAVIAAECGAKA